MAAFAALISVQTGAAFAKSLFPLVGAEGVAALRLGLSALWLSLWFRPWRLWRARPDWLALLGYGIMLGLMNLLIYRAFMYIHVSLAVSIEVIGPLAVALLNSRQRRDVLWVGLALLGLALLPFGQLGSGLDVRGVAYALAAALCWALYVVFGARAASGGGQAVATGMLVAALFAVPLGVAQSGAQLLTFPPLGPWWLVVVGAFFAIVVAKQLYGGLGNNLFNPAMVAFAVMMCTLI
jgi:inner membrane transporter RhtA